MFTGSHPCLLVAALLCWQTTTLLQAQTAWNQFMMCKRKQLSPPHAMVMLTIPCD
jgi:hypothetical protein